MTLPFFNLDVIEFITSMNSNLLTVYILIAVIMVLNMAILVPPSEFVGIAIGIAVFLTDLNWLLAISIATICNFIGTLTWYYAGRYRAGKKITWHKHKNWEDKVAAFLIKIERIEETYLKHGKALIFLLRLVPFIRALCSYPAGKIRMSFKDFAKYSIPGLALWMVIWSVLGIVLGQVAIKYHLYFSIGLGLMTYIIIKVGLTKFGKRFMVKVEAEAAEG